MRKLLYLPLLYPGGASEQQYLERAFEKHFEVLTFDFYNFQGDTSAEFLKIVQQFKPDIMHGQFQGTREIEPGALGVIKSVYPKVIITQWTGDVRENVIPQYVEYGKYCDINFVVSLTGVEEYQKAGLKDVRYWQNAIAIPEQLGVPSRSPKGIVFAGGKYTVFNQSEERIALVEAFEQQFPNEFTVYGFGWQSPPKCIPWQDQTSVYEKSYLVLGHNNVGGLKWWFSDRQLIAMASGRPHLCQYSEGLEEIFTDGEDCLMYRSISDALGKARWLLDNPKEATRIGLQGQKTVRTHHNWGKRVTEYLAHLEAL